MIIDELGFDIDNRDIEEEMIINDIEEEEQEEEDAKNKEIEQQEEKEAEEAEKSYYQTRRVLNEKNLNLDLTIPNEDARPRYMWESSKDNMFYKGYVVHKFDSTSFIFNASLKDENNFKLKKFKITDIKQVKK